MDLVIFEKISCTRMPWNYEARQKAAPTNVISDGICDLRKVSHTDEGFRVNVTGEIMVKQRTDMQEICRARLF